MLIKQTSSVVTEVYFFTMNKQEIIQFIENNKTDIDFIKQIKNITKSVNTVYRHWMWRTRIYRIWKWVKQRCWNPNHSYYDMYWWRWISYDKKWEKFLWFYEDMGEWYSDELSIDRIDNKLNYCKANCKWATAKEQARNTRKNVMYKWKCISQWAEELWAKASDFHNRLYRWYSVESTINYYSKI